MKVIFCDLCGLPIKNIKWNLVCTKYSNERKSDYNSAIDKSFSQKEINKEICETCKDIIDKIFEQRMVGILKLAKDLKTIYQMPTKTPKRKTKKSGK